MPVTLAAYKRLLEEHPELRGRVELDFVTESVFDEVDAAATESTDVLVLDVMNQQMVDRFNTEHDTNLIERINEHGRVIGVGEGLLPKESYVEQGVTWDERARALWAHSGLTNQLGLLKYAFAAAGAYLACPSSAPR